MRSACGNLADNLRITPRKTCVQSSTVIHDIAARSIGLGKTIIATTLSLPMQPYLLSTANKSLSYLFSRPLSTVSTAPITSTAL
jgi:hypothetical protein